MIGLLCLVIVTKKSVFEYFFCYAKFFTSAQVVRAESPMQRFTQHTYVATLSKFRFPSFATIVKTASNTFCTARSTFCAALKSWGGAFSVGGGERRRRTKNVQTVVVVVCDRSSCWHFSLRSNSRPKSFDTSGYFLR